MRSRCSESLKLLPALLLSLGPLLVLFAAALPRFADNVERLRPSAGRLAGLFARSAELSLLVALLALILGTSCALWLAGRKGVARRIGWLLLPLPLLLPRYVLGLTWWSLFDTSGFLGGFVSHLGVRHDVLNLAATAVVLSFAWFPVVTAVVLLDLEALPRLVLESASGYGRDARTWTRGILPGLLASLISSGAFIFCVAMTAYCAPALFQLPVYSTELYSEFSFSGDASMVALLAVPLVVLAIGCAPLFAAGFTLVPGRMGRDAFRPELFPKPPRWLSVLILLPVALALMVPLATPLLLAFRAGYPGVFIDTVSNALPAMVFSMETALASSLIAVLCALPIAARLFRRQSKLLLFLCVLPAIVPAPLYALGIPSSILSGGFAALVSAFAGRYLPFALLALVLVLRRVDRAPLEAADLLPPRLAWRRFRLKLGSFLPALLVAGAVVFSLSLGDLGVSVILAPPGAELFSVKLFNLLHYGAGDRAAALALSLIPAVYIVWATAAVAAWKMKK